MGINRIISKILLKNSTDGNLDTLKKWRNEVEDNIAVLNSNQIVDKIIDQTPEYQHYDQEAALNKIIGYNNRIVEFPERNKGIRNLILRACVAASILGIFAVYFMRDNTSYEFQSKNFVTTDFTQGYSLSDKSLIVLDKNSGLQEIAARQVSLKGRAFFNVTTDHSQSNFTVLLPVGKVEVLGTKFMIDSRIENQTIVYVQEGRVQYTVDNRKVVLVAGDYMKLSEGDISLISEMNKTSYTDWMKKRLEFNNASMEDIINTLAKAYGQKIINNVDDLTEYCRLNSVFQNSTFDEILLELNSVFGVKFKEKAGDIIIVDSDCKK